MSLRLQRGRKGSASEILRKRLDRSLQRDLIANLDCLLPQEARRISANGAGLSRAIGLQGRSIHDVLKDCVRHIKTLHLLASSDIVDLRNRTRTGEDLRLQQSGEIATGNPSFRASAASSQVSDFIPFFPEDVLSDKQAYTRNTLNDPLPRTLTICVAQQHRYISRLLALLTSRSSAPLMHCFKLHCTLTCIDKNLFQLINCLRHVRHGSRMRVSVRYRPSMTGILLRYMVHRV